MAELRDRGLHVSLRAYETRVFWKVRELQDTSGIWRRLAERLGGRGVPSLEGALRDLQLMPVHEAVRAAIAAPSRDAASLVVDAVAEATGTGDPLVRAAVVDAIAARAATTEVVAAGIEDPSQAAALRVSVLLAPLGSLPAGAPVGPTSRAWYDELRLAPIVAEGLRARGLDEAEAWWAAERVRLLLDLPLPSSIPGAPERVPFRLIASWLEHPAAAPFLRVNQWDGVTWFHGESLDELLAWAARLERVSSPEAPASPALAAIAAASAASGFRVDALRDALRVPGEEVDVESGSAATASESAAGPTEQAEAVEPEADAAAAAPVVAEVEAAETAEPAEPAVEAFEPAVESARPTKAKPLTKGPKPAKGAKGKAKTKPRKKG